MFFMFIIIVNITQTVRIKKYFLGEGVPSLLLAGAGVSTREARGPAPPQPGWGTEVRASVISLCIPAWLQAPWVWVSGGCPADGHGRGHPSWVECRSCSTGHVRWAAGSGPGGAVSHRSQRTGGPAHSLGWGGAGQGHWLGTSTGGGGAPGILPGPSALPQQPWGASATPSKSAPFLELQRCPWLQPLA